MDGGRFDAMARGMVATRTRRATLRSLLGGALTMGMTRLDRDETGAACLPGEPCSCKRNGKQCAHGGQCCSGICAVHAPSPGVCVCRGLGQACETNKNCCSGVCDARANRCSCKSVGQICDADKHCCSGYCRRGRCGCAPLGGSCRQGADCCSGWCDNGTCDLEPPA
jgi:hypothetical protein